MSLEYPKIFISKFNEICTEPLVWGKQVCYDPSKNAINLDYYTGDSITFDIIHYKLSGYFVVYSQNDSTSKEIPLDEFVNDIVKAFDSDFISTLDDESTDSNAWFYYDDLRCLIEQITTDVPSK